jgi:hypothetical protein
MYRLFPHCFLPDSSGQVYTHMLWACSVTDQLGSRSQHHKSLWVLSSPRTDSNGLRVKHSILAFYTQVKEEILTCKINLNKLKPESVDMLRYNSFQINPFLDIYTFFRDCDQCRSRSASTSMPSDLDLHWLHFGQK